MGEHGLNHHTANVATGNRPQVRILPYPPKGLWQNRKRVGLRGHLAGYSLSPVTDPNGDRPTQHLSLCQRKTPYSGNFPFPKRLISVISTRQNALFTRPRQCTFAPGKLFGHKSGSVWGLVPCTQMPPAYADFGEIRSVYDVRAMSNSMALIDSPFARGLRRNRISPRYFRFRRFHVRKGIDSPMHELAGNRLWRSFGLQWNVPISSMRGPMAEAPLATTVFGKICACRRHLRTS